MSFVFQAVIWENRTDVAAGGSDNKGPPCLGGRRAYSASLELEDSITAVDFAPVALSERRYHEFYHYRALNEQCLVT
jgi:hypothetical protein